MIICNVELVEKHECVYHKFAFDTQIENAGGPSDFDEVWDKIEECIDEVGNWMPCNHLKLNEDKTEALKMETKAKCLSVYCDSNNQPNTWSLLTLRKQ